MKKRIKITSRGSVITSRGPMITPNTRPFLEDVDYLLRMIAKGARVVEVLSDGTEIELNERNFNTDNTVKKVKQVKVEPVTTEPITDKTPIVPHMTRQERKRAEYEKKMAAQKAQEEAKKLAQSTQVSSIIREEVKPTETVITDTNVDSAIEE